MKILKFIHFFLDNILYVKGLLNRLSDPRQIPNWSNEGSILLDYIEISEKVLFQYFSTILIKIKIFCFFF